MEKNDGLGDRLWVWLMQAAVNSALDKRYFFNKDKNELLVTGSIGNVGLNSVEVETLSFSFKKNLIQDFFEANELDSLETVYESFIANNDLKLPKLKEIDEITHDKWGVFSGEQIAAWIHNEVIEQLGINSETTLINHMNVQREVYTQDWT